MSAEENKALIRRYIENVWNKGDIAAVAGYVAADVVLHGFGPETLRGLPAVEQTFATFRAAFPDLTVEIDDLIAEGSRVAIRYTMRGTHRGPIAGPGRTEPPTGRTITISGINLARIAGGKMVEGWAQLDALGMMQQLGVSLGQPEA